MNSTRVHKINVNHQKRCTIAFLRNNKTDKNQNLPPHPKKSNQKNIQKLFKKMFKKCNFF